MFPLRLFSVTAGLLLAITTTGATETAASALATPGGAAPPPADAAVLSPEEEALLAALLGSPWQHTTSLRGAVGWRDNVLLSPFRPIERLFGRVELESLWMRLLGAHAEFVSFLNGDVLRYFSPTTDTSGEHLWFAHAELRWDAAAPLRLAAKADAFLQDSVLDLSETEGSRLVAPTRSRGAFATLSARVALPARFSLEPLVQVKRTDYREFPGDYDETVAGLRAEWTSGQRWRAALAGHERWRRYADRPNYTAGGRALPETRLRFRQRDAEAKLGFDWNRHGRWSAQLAAGWLQNRDRASGFFDYDQKRARLELTWSAQPWRVLLSGEARRVNYLVQTVGIGIAPPPRIEDAFDTRTRVERSLGLQWSVFAEHAWERSRSNAAEFSYRANTVLAGAQWTF